MRALPLIIGAAALLCLGGIYIVMSLSRFRESAGAMEQTARELLTRLQKIELRIADGEEKTGSELEKMRREQREAAAASRMEQQKSASIYGDTQAKRSREIGDQQRESLAAFSQQLTGISSLNEEKLEAMRKTFEEKLEAMRLGNEQKLESMRATVDEKLHSTLEKRLGEAFASVSQRLEEVHRGLGEMRTLSAGVGDLKQVLTNVKVRGTWGETQLAALLEQILTKEQYAENVATRPGRSERVEFALRLPGRGSGEVWLPIDSKFPLEDYKRLQEASEAADIQGTAEAQKALAQRLLGEGKSIHEKYIEPPYTTDFAVLYLPTEGLYAEALRIDGLTDQLSRLYRVIPAGPTTICALLNSLQLGFRTLAVEKRSSEVWTLLGQVKTEFESFGRILENTRKKIETASRELDKAGTRTKVINRALSGVQRLTPQEGSALISLTEEAEEPEPVNEPEAEDDDKES